MAHSTPVCPWCGANYNASDFVRLPCNHDVCTVCFSQCLDASFTTKHPYAPVCCGDDISSDDIPTGAGGITIERLNEFRLREEEFTTPHPTYCSSSHCGIFIPAKHVAHNIATCPQPACTLRTCTLCKERAHPGENCPSNNELDALVQEQGWKRCRRCRRVIELGAGCSHVSKSLISANRTPHCPFRIQLCLGLTSFFSTLAVCRCGRQFCYSCGADWVDKGKAGACYCPTFRPDAGAQNVGGAWGWGG